MIDRMQDLQLKISELDKNREAQWIELQQELRGTFSNTWFDILLNKNTSPINQADNPIIIAIRQATEFLIDKTALGKSKNKWAILLQHEIENLMPEIISILVRNKNKAD